MSGLPSLFNAKVKHVYDPTSTVVHVFMAWSFDSYDNFASFKKCIWTTLNKTLLPHRIEQQIKHPTKIQRHVIIAAITKSLK
jgi:hypothetical protein